MELKAPTKICALICYKLGHCVSSRRNADTCLGCLDSLDMFMSLLSTCKLRTSQDSRCSKDVLSIHALQSDTGKNYQTGAGKNQY